MWGKKKPDQPCKPIQPAFEIVQLSEHLVEIRRDAKVEVDAEDLFDDGVLRRGLAKLLQQQKVVAFQYVYGSISGLDGLVVGVSGQYPAKIVAITEEYSH